MKEIRTLDADEIDVRAQQIKDKGGIFLLYKDARCDMRILDEVYGVTGWQRSHDLINGNLFCTVEIWDSEKKMWIKKQDVGTESNTEKEKGQASDSFKRACFNLGIGRELYTSPFIWITPIQGEDMKYAKFTVKSIEYNDKREIVSLTIIDSKGNVRFQFENGKSKRIEQPKPKEAAKPKVTKEDDADLALVFQEIKEAKTITELTSIFNNWGCFQSNKEFVSALTSRKNELKQTA